VTPQFESSDRFWGRAHLFSPFPFPGKAGAQRKRKSSQICSQKLAFCRHVQGRNCQQAAPLNCPADGGVRPSALTRSLLDRGSGLDHCQPNTVIHNKIISPNSATLNSLQTKSLGEVANRVERAMQHIEKVVLRIAVTGTPEGIRECVRNFALDLPNDISRVEFAPLEGVEQLGAQDRADFAPPRQRRKRPRATGVQIQTRVSHRHQSRAPRHSA
jgi:hypothetical protein